MGALIWFATWAKGNGSECFAYYLNWFLRNLVKGNNVKALPAIAIKLFDEFKARE